MTDRAMLLLALSVRLSVPLLRVCCCGPGGQKISIDCCTAGVRRANAGSGTLVVVVVSLIITLSTAKLDQFCRLKLYEVKYNIRLNDVHMYIHSNNKTDKTINVSKIANSSTLDDNVVGVRSS